MDSYLSQGYYCYVKCNQFRAGFEFVSPGSFPTMITITPWVPPHQALFMYFSYLHFIFWYIYIYIYIYIYTHTHIYIVIIKSHLLHRVPWLSLSTSIPPGRFSRLQLVSAQSWCEYVFASWLTLAYSYARVHKKISLMSSSLLLHQCLTCLFHLTWIVYEMRGKWLYSCCFVWCRFQDLFKTACSIFYTYIYIYISIVIHRQICFVLSELISVARHISFP